MFCSAWFGCRKGSKLGGKLGSGNAVVFGILLFRYTQETQQEYRFFFGTVAPSYPGRASRWNNGFGALPNMMVSTGQEYAYTY